MMRLLSFEVVSTLCSSRKTRRIPTAEDLEVLAQINSPGFVVELTPAQAEARAKKRRPNEQWLWQWPRQQKGRGKGQSKNHGTAKGKSRSKSYDKSVHKPGLALRRKA